VTLNRLSTSSTETSFPKLNAETDFPKSNSMQAKRKYLTDRTLGALTPAEEGQRYEVWDTKIPGFGVRVADKADRTRHGKSGPTRRTRRAGC